MVKMSILMLFLAQSETSKLYKSTNIFTDSTKKKNPTTLCKSLRTAYYLTF